MKQQALRRADARTALLAAAGRLIARGSQPFTTAAIERAARQPAGSIDANFRSRNAFAKALADTVKRTLLQRWKLEPEAVAPAPTKVKAAASPQWPPTRVALVEAGKRLLASGRLDATSIDGLVAEAGVGKGSFFNHFGSREELLRAVLGTVQDELGEAISACLGPAQDPVEQIAHGFVASLRYGLSNQLGARAMTRLMPGATAAAVPVNFQLRQIVRAAMATGGVLVTDLDVAASMVIGLSEAGLMRLLSARHDPAQVDALVDELCLTALQMLSVDASRREALAAAAVRAGPPDGDPTIRLRPGRMRK